MSGPETVDRCLAACCDRAISVALLQQHRPYWELLPSLRRPAESLLPLPLPLVRRRERLVSDRGVETVVQLTPVPCELVFLLCDPEWKVKVGPDICLLIHRPEESFNDLLDRWRKTQICLSQPYEWHLEETQKQFQAEAGEAVLPLFLLQPDGPELIRKALTTVGLPWVTLPLELPEVNNLVPAIS
ncbi:hypothetical protein [Synechococcus elongatus]|uniref:Uncharacterized protein n=1 Tax=Synechococcus elongatus PCC 11801 TaxID=2219813 RepID=A0AAN1QMU3_SYNEL|nr:hypothetical protein [Synechococcus elongatus]AZB72270.1 hypothetical protein DOP62_05615 [Synechococcus elongatus PCC 11801]